MRCRLHEVFDKEGRQRMPQPGVVIDLNLNKDGTAEAFVEDQTAKQSMLRLERCRVEWVAGLGMLISGVERSGESALQYRHQEWWVVTPTVFEKEGCGRSANTNFR